MNQILKLVITIDKGSTINIVADFDNRVFTKEQAKEFMKILLPEDVKNTIDKKFHEIIER